MLTLWLCIVSLASGSLIIIEAVLSFAIDEKDFDLGKITLSDFSLTKPTMADNRLIEMEVCYSEPSYKSKDIFRDGLIDTAAAGEKTDVTFRIDDREIVSVGGDCSVSGGSVVMDAYDIPIPAGRRTWPDYLGAQSDRKASTPCSSPIVLPLTEKDLHQTKTVKVRLFFEFPTSIGGNQYRVSDKTRDQEFSLFVVSRDEMMLRRRCQQVNRNRVRLAMLGVGVGLIATGIRLKKVYSQAQAKRGQV